MINKILEVDYKGFHFVLSEGKPFGWKCVIGEEEILFPHMQAAENAIDEIVEGTSDIIKKHDGVVIGKVFKSHVTKSVIVEDPYK